MYGHSETGFWDLIVNGQPSQNCHTYQYPKSNLKSSQECLFQPEAGDNLNDHYSNNFILNDSGEYNNDQLLCSLDSSSGNDFDSLLMFNSSSAIKSQPLSLQSDHSSMNLANEQVQTSELNFGNQLTQKLMEYSRPSCDNGSELIAALAETRKIIL
jgi:hypothetical protein